MTTGVRSEWQDSKVKMGSLNSGGTDLTAPVSDINRLCDTDNRVMPVMGPTTLDKQTYDGKWTALMQPGGAVITLPPATATGALFRIGVGVDLTSGSFVVKCSGSDSFRGRIQMTNGVSGSVSGWPAIPGDNTITFNGSTTGGFISDYVEFIDNGVGVWGVRGDAQAIGSSVTPFSTV